MPSTLAVIREILETEAFQISPPWIAVQFGVDGDGYDPDGVRLFSIYLVLRHPESGLIRTVFRTYQLAANPT